jgi:hypothetical protein
VNKDAQLTIVNKLCMTAALEIGTLIDEGKVPEEWDGHELRVLVADKLKDAASISVIVKDPRSQRAKDFRNTVLVKNL